MIKLQGTSLLIATYGCFVTYVPSNPNLYKLTADTVGSICSFLACVTLQVYLASSAQQTILGGLCIQFLLTTEAAIMHFWTLSLVTNIAHEEFSTFYVNNPEISKYVMNPKPLACCFCASLVILSATRLLLIALPSYYQGLPRKTCLAFSAAFNLVILISDFLLNHVRCLLTHSKHYESADGEQSRIELGISTQTLNITSTGNDDEQLECFQIRFAAILLFLSFLIEVIKMFIFLSRLLRKNKQTAPTVKIISQDMAHLEPLPPDLAGVSLKLKRSCSVSDIKIQMVQKPKKRRLSLQLTTAKEIYHPGVKNLPVKKISKVDSDNFQKMVIKPFKEFLCRSSTISFLVTTITFITLINVIISFETKKSESSFWVLSSSTRIIIFLLPILLVVFDEKVLDFVYLKLSCMSM